MLLGKEPALQLQYNLQCTLYVHDTWTHGHADPIWICLDILDILDICRHVDSTHIHAKELSKIYKKQESSKQFTKKKAKTPFRKKMLPLTRNRNRDRSHNNNATPTTPLSTTPKKTKPMKKPTLLCLCFLATFHLHQQSMFQLFFDKEWTSKHLFDCQKHDKTTLEKNLSLLPHPWIHRF